MTKRTEDTDRLDQIERFSPEHHQAVSALLRSEQRAQQRWAEQRGES